MLPCGVQGQQIPVNPPFPLWKDGGKALPQFPWAFYHPCKEKENGKTHKEGGQKKKDIPQMPQTYFP